MALTKSFNGNVVDETGTPIDCTVKGYHVEQGVWSGVYNTLTQFYSLDLGDSTWLTQDGATGATDTITLVFETTEVNPLNRRFAVYTFTMTGADTYIQDVQIQPCLAPVVSTLWDLNSPTDGKTTFVNAANANTPTYIGRINESISVTEAFTDEKTWVYATATMSHQINVGTTNVFGDRLGIATKTYDWDQTNTFITNTSHIFTLISPITGLLSQQVETSVTNLKGLVTNDILYIQLRYNTPVPGLSYTPLNPSVLDTFTVTGNVVDVDSRISAISWQYDAVEVANNTTLAYSWIQSLGTLYVPAGHTVSDNLTWNDGFNTFTIVDDHPVAMTNLPPSFTLTDAIVGIPESNDIIFTLSGLTDPDGDNALLEAKWTIEYIAPFSGGTITVLNTGYPATIDTAPKEWVFATAGTYIITATIKDQYGVEATQSITKVFASGSACTGTGTIRLNFSATPGAARWQLIAVPVQNKQVSQYFLDRIDAMIKTYDPTKSVLDVVERVSAYPGNLGKFLTFIPGVTPITSEGNFSLVMEDGTNIFEILGFWVKIKDYSAITGGAFLDYTWDMAA